jgi:hypothetical protein
MLTLAKKIGHANTARAKAKLQNTLPNTKPKSLSLLQRNHEQPDAKAPGASTNKNQVDAAHKQFQIPSATCNAQALRCFVRRSRIPTAASAMSATGQRDK